MSQFEVEIPRVKSQQTIRLQGGVPLPVQVRDA